MTALRNCPVLVVGGMGFIGSNLTARLAGEQALVTVLTPARSRYASELQAIERDGVTVVEGDIRDAALMTPLVADQRIIFNLSGQSGAVRSMEDPWADLDVNLRGSLTLLEAVRRANPSAKIVVAGSRLQYGRPASLPAAEDDAREPLCVHAVHKHTVEEYLKLYSRLFGLRFVVARITNPYGPGQPSGRTTYGVINRMIHLALADETLTIYGDGEQQRDYLHVSDVVEAMVRLALSPQSDGRIYNVGSGTGTRLIDVARLVIEVAGGGRIKHVAWPPLAEQIETGDFVADISRIRDEIGWSPAIPLREGLEQTASFYRARVPS